VGQQVVTRHKDNTAVAMWEMINEPGSFSNGAYTDTMLRAFFDETSAAIKAIDRNHLVATGVLSEDMKGTRDYAYLHGGANVDVATLHEYEYDWTTATRSSPGTCPASSPRSRPSTSRW
jgi:mannan endo-1,4-beta-mannosidase